ncbi:MAG: tripartite tricarboxylate transporter substrate binding protein [Betaproteobacteria bacterium]|nr:tripartite tricarboxylate transporter substrate binding protein [Betaproteobacteria bacterium]MBI3055112.1 tripartite tricarboxylate transporter substrate binding protein [Betaproteobacteria bacterium]
MTKIIMRRALAMGFAGLAAALAAVADAADYPARPLRYIVGFAPGGINDILARIVGQKLNESWGHAVIVDNRPGAGGNLAAGLVAKSTADGYTFMNISTAHAISQTLYARLDYSLERDLTPVVVLGNSPLIMVVHAGIPAKNVAELVDWAKKNRLIYASGGIGVISHLSLEMFKVAARIEATHVPYKGVGPAVPDLISGQAHVMVNAIPELLPHTKGGRLRVIGSMTEQRHPFIPAVPTFIEQGYKEFVMGNWTGIVAPAGTPKPVVNKLAAEVTRIIRSPEISKRLIDQGVDPLGGTPEEFGKLIRAETVRFGKAVKESGAKAE